MPNEISLDDLSKKQAEMSALMVEIQNETDAGRIQAIAERLRELGSELEAMARGYEEQEGAKGTGSNVSGRAEVVLTAAQRQRIFDATGVQMESLILPDKSGKISRSMPTTDSRIIEYRAMQEAQRRKTGTELEQEMRAQIAEVVRALEEASPAVAEKLEELKRDPNFLAGLLREK